MRVKFPQLIIGKHILQAFERYGVPDFYKLAQRFASHTPGGTDGRGVLGVLLFQLLELSEHMVVVEVRNLRILQHVVLVIVVFKLLCQALYFQFCISCIHGISCLSYAESIAPISK